MNITFLCAALAIMGIVFLREFLKKRYNFDMDNVDGKELQAKLYINETYTIQKATGYKSLILIDAGNNKATVMATLRQITGIDYNLAKNIVNSAPAKLMANVSEKEATLTKKALEFVGARVEIL